MASTRRSRISAALFASALLALPVAASAVTDTVVVRDGAMNGWEAINRDGETGRETASTTTKGSSGRFGLGPAGVQEGVGSFRTVVGDSTTDTVQMRTSMFNGVSLASISELSYKTFVQANFDSQAPYLRLYVDLTANGTWESELDDVLFFEPAYQNGTYSGDPVPNQCPGIARCVGLNTWQTWHGETGGWWTARDGASGPPLQTLANYALAHPGAKLATGIPALRITSGGGGPWRNFDGSIDTLRIKATMPDGKVADTMFDFEAGPLISSDLAGRAFATTSINVTGTSVAGSTVVLRDGSNTIATLSCPDGTWGTVLTFTEGAHSLTATASKDGFVSPASEPVRFTVDLTSPAAPGINAPADGSTTMQRVSFRGSAEAGARVEISEAGGVLADTIADFAGKWERTWLFSDGDHTIVAQAIDAAGNRSPASAARTFTADAFAPVAVITKPASETVFTPLNPASIEGTATDNRAVASVEVRLSDVLGRETLTTATCDCGTKAVSWSISAESLLPGRYTVKVVAIDAGGNRSQRATGAFTKVP